jgi:hypothetical protein
MKKLITILILLVSISCTTTNTEVIEEVPIVPKNVEIVITTNTPEFDEIVVSYKDFDVEEEWIYGPRQFNYDSNGNQEPIIISFPAYTYQEIVGNAYRNNDLPYTLKAEIFIDGELVLEEETVGSEGVYASINFDYTLEN